MNIVILDDNPYDLKLASSIVTEYMSIHDKEANITTYSDAHEVLKCSCIDCFILDVLLPQDNGVLLSYTLLKNNPSAKIIFMSSTTEFSPPAHAVKPIGYLVKPVKKNYLFTLLDQLMNSYEHNPITIIDNLKFKRKIYSNTILHISHHDYKNNTKVCLLHGNVIIARQTMDQWKEILNPKLFFLVYKNVLVNIENIERIVQRTIKFKDGSSISGSRKYMRDLEQHLFDYLDDQSWY